MKAPQAILFDFGGTLDADGVAWKDRFRSAVGFEGEAERFDRAFYAADDPLVGTIPRDLSLKETVERLSGNLVQELGLDPATAPRVAKAFYRDALAKAADSARILERLSGRFRLGVVSNFYGNVARILADARIAPLLTVIADSNRVGWMKPDRRLFEHALRGLDAEPHATLHVGDSYERDVRAAHALGLRTAWLVAGDRSAAAADPLADLTISSLGDLERALAQRTVPALAAG